MSSWCWQAVWKECLQPGDTIYLSLFLSLSQFSRDVQRGLPQPRLPAIIPRGFQAALIAPSHSILSFFQYLSIHIHPFAHSLHTSVSVSIRLNPILFGILFYSICFFQVVLVSFFCFFPFSLISNTIFSISKIILSTTKMDNIILRHFFFPLSLFSVHGVLNYREIC